MEITTTMIVQDNEIKEFTCFTCQKRFPLISDLTRHLTTEHKPDEALSLFEKPRPSKVETEKDAAVCVPTQSSSVSGERTRALCRSQFFCSVCNRGFALKHHVVRHEEKIHNIVRPKMRGANRVDTTPKTVVYVPNEVGGMTSHLQPLHQEPSISSTTDLTPIGFASSSVRQPRARPHICEVCAKGFTQRHHLKRHMEQAHKPKEALEEVSGDTTSCLAVVPVTLSDANELVQAKPDKPLHRCSSCYRGFTERHHMIRHEKTVHESKKDHHCILCGKLFSQKHHLLNHQIAIHCKTRNYACSVCSKKFSLKHQLQRHEKRVHNTQILPDGTVIKKRRQKKEIGPDGKPRLTWTGGEIIGFAGPPNEGGGVKIQEVLAITSQNSGGGRSNNEEKRGDGNRDDGEASDPSRTASTSTDELLRHAGLQLGVGECGGKSGGGSIRGAGGKDAGVLEKVGESKRSLPSDGGVPMLPAVEGEERYKVEALLLKLSNAKQIQSSSSAPLSPALNHSSKDVPSSSPRSAHHPPSPQKVSGTTSPAVTPQYLVNAASASPSSSSESSLLLPPPQTAMTTSRSNQTNPKHQFLPPAIFAPPGTSGFQTSPFFHMASNVISGLPPMDGVTDANRKWAFLGEPGASSAPGASLPNTDGIAPPTQCNFQAPNLSAAGRDQILSPTTSQTPFLGSQSALYTNAAYPISMTQHQPQHSVLQFPPLG